MHNETFHSKYLIADFFLDPADSFLHLKRQMYSHVSLLRHKVLLFLTLCVFKSLREIRSEVQNHCSL